MGPPNGGGFETLWPIIILSPHIQVFALRLQQHSPGPGKPFSDRLLGAVLVWQPASLSGLWAALAVEAVAGTVGMDDAFFVPNEVPETDNETLVRLDGELKGTTMLEKPRVSKKVGRGGGRLNIMQRQDTQSCSCPRTGQALLCYGCVGGLGPSCSPPGRS